MSVGEPSNRRLHLAPQSQSYDIALGGIFAILASHSDTLTRLSFYLFDTIVGAYAGLESPPDAL